MAKEMIKQILHIKISNLKRNDFVEELRVFPIISNITANFQTEETALHFLELVLVLQCLAYLLLGTFHFLPPDVLPQREQFILKPSAVRSSGLLFPAWNILFPLHKECTPRSPG